MPTPANLETNPIHLGLGARAIEQPTFAGLEWYAAYAQRHEGDGAEGRLVTLHRFTESWRVWEMHPRGDEVVVCLEGAITLIQERSGGQHLPILLRPSEYAINPPGLWHTADIVDKGDRKQAGATALFITAGLDTQNRPRQNATL